MNDFIYIDDLKIYATHGVLNFEKENGQFFYLSARILLPLSAAAATDDLALSVNYAEICRRITDFVRSHCFDLIETLCERTIDELMRSYPVFREVTLTVKKPSAPIGLPLKTVAISMTRTRHAAYIALGSNMGNKEHYLKEALRLLDLHPCCKVTKVSDFLITKPYGPVAQDDFLNACAEVETWMSSEDFLSLLLKTEAENGRTRLIHWGPRTLDLDLLLFDDEIKSTAFLTLPHPEMHKRRFVLEPLNQIAPYALHPLLMRRISELYESLPT